MFALVLPRRPPSYQGRPNRMFQEAIRQHAFQAHAGGMPMVGNLYAWILWFHRGPTSQEVDNIAKNILDALKGVVYADDVTITRCLAVKVRLDTDEYLLAAADPVPQVVDELIRLLRDEAIKDVLYVEIGFVTDGTIYFGQAR